MRDEKNLQDMTADDLRLQLYRARQSRRQKREAHESNRSFPWPNGLRLSGARKGVRCSRGFGDRPAKRLFRLKAIVYPSKQYTMRTWSPP